MTTATRRSILPMLAGAAAATSVLSRPSFAQEGPIKIGGIFPLTGAGSVFGNQNFQGVEIAVDLINDRGGINGRKVVLFKGDGHTPQAAISETNRLLAREGVRIFTGSSTSAVGMVASQEAERNGAFYWEGMAVANDFTARGFKNVFRVGLDAGGLGRPAPLYVAEALAGLLKKSSKDIRIAIIAEDSAFGVDVSSTAVAEAKKLGIAVALHELYSAKTTDLSPLVLKLRSVKPDAIVATQFINDAVLLQRQMKEMRYRPPAFIGTSAGHSTLSFAEAIGDDVNGIFSSSYPNDANPDGLLPETRSDREEFLKRYQAKYKVVPAVQESLGFVVGMALIRDIIGKAMGADTAGLRDAALAADVPAGSYINGWGMKFDEKGQNLRAFGSMVQWQSRRMVSVYPAANKMADPILVPLPAWGAR
ncbi:ABC transporter substrate-binding protein [Enterovirga rhinocerotis]|uniref:Amino acid/amide ABC transporter substrate-binding protein (HAAT family) n=1 Tax=Enterovirga rhinocerotis TaxID=1339210 RepID=A0A4V3DYP9_9HYPH|nr:ABC transporter substrate-binding protein [Enterovirga rhinocerotis]TDR92979.1 amino acid/amide ABC transporter substrate-binding protein (HAAT family) [Enterovirga rhinocerotis]